MTERKPRPGDRHRSDAARTRNTSGRRDVQKASRREGVHQGSRSNAGASSARGTKARTADAPYKTPSGHEPVHLADEIVRELKATARPGKGDILVKVFADAAAAFVAEDYSEAIKLAEQAKHIALRAIAVRELLGLAYYREGQWKQAASELSAFRRMTGTPEQNPVLADCYRALGRPERALELCAEAEAAASTAPVRYEATIVAAGALADMGNIEDAIARLEKLDLEPDVAEEHHLRAWYLLADLLQRKGRFTQAREWFHAVASADADLTDAAERAARLK